MRISRRRSAPPRVRRFAIRYRRRSPDQVGSKFDESSVLEITWTVIPLLIVLFTFVWGAKVYFRLSRPPAQAVEYHVTGKAVDVEDTAPDRAARDQRAAPAGGSADQAAEDLRGRHPQLLHPRLPTKADVLPGRYTSIWFNATKPGRYHLFCAEYCGAEHSRMIGSIVVQSPEDYQKWLASVPVPQAPAAQGQQLFTQLACTSCHQEGSDDKGPALAGLYGSAVRLADDRDGLIVSRIALSVHAGKGIFIKNLSEKLIL